MSRAAILALTVMGSALASPALAQDHSHHGHTMAAPEDVSPGPTMETPPPPEAGSGPPRAADAIWGAEVMAAERERERKTGIRQDPLVRAVLERFPGAEIVAVRDVNAAASAGADDDAPPPDDHVPYSDDEFDGFEPLP